MGSFRTEFMFTVRNVDGKSSSNSNGHKKLDAKITDVAKCCCMVNLKCVLCEIDTELRSCSVFT